MSKLSPSRGNKITNYNRDSYDDFMLDFHNIHKRFLSLFDEFLDSRFLPKGVGNKYSFSNNYNIEKLSEDTYRININVAGFKKEDIDIFLDNGILTIQGSMKNIQKDKYLHQGFASQFYNQFNIEEESAIDAYIDNGILVITIKEHLAAKRRAKKILIK